MDYRFRRHDKMLDRAESCLYNLDLLLFPDQKLLKDRIGTGTVGIDFPDTEQVNAYAELIACGVSAVPFYSSVAVAFGEFDDTLPLSCEQFDFGMSGKSGKHVIARNAVVDRAGIEIIINITTADDETESIAGTADNLLGTESGDIERGNCIILAKC